MINGNAQWQDLKDKYVFWDIDGTLAPYRFNGHVADPDGTDNGMSLKEIEDDVFYTEHHRSICRKYLQHVMQNSIL